MGSSIKGFCKRADRSVFARYADIEKAREEIKRLAESGMLNELTETLLLGSRGAIAKRFDQELANINETNKVALSIAGEYLLDTMFFLSRLKSQAGKTNPEVIRALSDMLESLESVKNKHGL